METLELTLNERVGHVEDLVTPPRSLPEPVHDDVELVERRDHWFRSVQDGVLDLSKSLPEGTQDFDARKLFEFLLELQYAIQRDSSASDSLGEVELATMRMADVLHRLTRKLSHSALDDSETAVRFVFQALPEATNVDFAELLDVSTKTISTWRAGGAVSRNANRVVLVAQVISNIKSSLTPRGVLMWFSARRPQLSEMTPIELMNQDLATAQDALITISRGLRGQLAG